MTDLKFALRQFARTPGFALMAVATLALGLGANSAIFSLINGILLHPYPYHDPERLVLLSTANEGTSERRPATYPLFLDWRDQCRAFGQLAYVQPRAFNLTGRREPVLLRGASVSASAFPLLGIRPALGRWLAADDDRPGAAPVTILSHRLWVAQFDGDPGVLGRTLLLNGRSYSVAGIMPAGFEFWNADLWVPAGLDADTPIARNRALRTNAYVVGRLAPDRGLAEARIELEMISRRLARQYPDSDGGREALAVPLVGSGAAGIRTTLLVLLGAVALVLLIGCANVASLLIARNTGRQRELALRLALGASIWRLTRQLLLESLLLAAAGGVGGILVAAWILDLLPSLLPGGVPRGGAVTVVDPHVLLFTAGAAVAAALLGGLVPAVLAARADPDTALKEASRSATGGRQSRGLRSALVAAEVALAFTLLAGAGLLLRSFWRLAGTDPGFAAERLLVLKLQLPDKKYPAMTQAADFYRRVVEHLRRLPGARAVGGAMVVPLTGDHADFPLMVDRRAYGATEEVESAQFNIVLGDYFAAQGIRVRAGRALTDADTERSAPAVVINAALARKFFPGTDPLGRKVRLGLPDSQLRPGLLPPGFDRFRWATIVGVVDDVRLSSLRRQPVPIVYVPWEQAPDTPLFHNTTSLLIRTAGDPLATVAGARRAIWQVDRDQPIARTALMESIVDGSVSQPRFAAVLLASFAGVALVLAIIGITGVVAWNVSRRKREIGVRLALGASPEAVRWLVVRQGMAPVLAGLAAGATAALLLTHSLHSLLYEISPFDPAEALRAE